MLPLSLFTLAVCAACAVVGVALGCAIEPLRRKCLITQDEENEYHEMIGFCESFGIDAERFRRGLQFRKSWPICSTVVTIFLQLVVANFTRTRLLP